MPDDEFTLRMLALNDERSIAALLAQSDTGPAGGCSDPQMRALVRLAAVIASNDARGSSRPPHDSLE